jgi:hypothetical protein
MATEQLQSDAAAGVAAADILASVSGLDFLRLIADGRFPGPPIAELLGFRPVEVEKGRIVFAATPGPRHYNPIGSVHGGYAATLTICLPRMASRITANASCPTGALGLT